MRWKLVIAHHITPKKIDGSLIHLLTMEIMKRAEETGAIVNGYVTDMAPVNMAFWKILGVDAKRKCHVRSDVAHPLDETRRFFLLADGPHLMKNMKSSLENNKVFKFSQLIVDKYDLKSNMAKYRYI